MSFEPNGRVQDNISGCRTTQTGSFSSGRFGFSSGRFGCSLIGGLSVPVAFEGTAIEVFSGWMDGRTSPTAPQY
jgi:hypothetical protein